MRSVIAPTLRAVGPETLRDWIAEHPPSDQVFRQSLTLVGERVLAGEELRFAVRELSRASSSRVWAPLG